jgi:hypothetical protein
MTQPGTPGNADAASPAAGGEYEFARFYRDHIGRLAAYLMYQGRPRTWPPTSHRTR